MQCSQRLGLPNRSCAQHNTFTRFQRVSTPGAALKSRRPVAARAHDSIVDALSSSLHVLPHAVNQLALLADDAGTAAAAVASSSGGGPVGLLADTFEAALKVLDDNLENAGVPYSYGFSIILLTVMVKLATFPLSKKQVESTIGLQALQPRVKELQAKYANDTETLQIETARLYKEAGVNPLAGCLPTLATIPVFIGLYRALTKAADDGLLTSGFFWIPSLGGPTTMTARQAGNGLSWLFPLENGAPPIGWHDAIAYLVLPVLLVVSQYFTQRLTTPPNNDPSQETSRNILKFLPLMIGWFSLNVPSGLTLYWFINNVLSTAQQLYLKSSVKAPEVATATAGAGSTTTVDAQVIRPKEERVKKVSGKEINARGKKKSDDDAEEGQQPQGDRGKKFRALKAREAAAKAAATTNGSSNGGVTTQVEQQVKVPDAPPSKME